MMMMCDGREDLSLHHHCETCDHGAIIVITNIFLYGRIPFFHTNLDSTLQIALKRAYCFQHGIDSNATPPETKPSSRQTGLAVVSFLQVRSCH